MRPIDSLDLTSRLVRAPFASALLAEQPESTFAALQDQPYERA
jgi:hypothetical protein